MPRRGWDIPEHQATTEDAFLQRRKFIKTTGLGAVALLAGCGYEKSFDSFAEEGDCFFDVYNQKHQSPIN